LKKIFALVAIAAAALSTPSLAADFTGPRIEVTAGFDDVTKANEVADVTYGAAVGIDAPLFGSNKLIVGVEASVDNVLEYRDYGVSARLGYKLADNVLAYAKAGYADFRGLEGVRVGGGFEYAVTNNLYAKVEYRYSDLELNVGRHQGLVGVGIRF